MFELRMGRGYHQNVKVCEQRGGELGVSANVHIYFFKI